jgi:hypothetical protein
MAVIVFGTGKLHAIPHLRVKRRREGDGGKAPAAVALRAAPA